MATPTNNGWPENKTFVLGKLADHDTVHKVIGEKIDKVMDGIDDLKTGQHAVKTDIAVIKTKQAMAKGKVSQKVFFFVVIAFLILLGADATGLFTLVP